MTKPDKYDEEALNVVRGFDFEDSIQDMAGDVAAFGRKCAADAYEDAANTIYSSGWNDVHERGSFRDHSQALKDIVMKKAAALRGKP